MSVKTAAEELLGKRVRVHAPGNPAYGKCGRVGRVDLEMFRPALVRVILDNEAGMFEGNEKDVAVLEKQCSCGEREACSECCDEVQRKPHRPICGICSEVVRVGFWVPREIKELALHQSQWEDNVCLGCFTKLADERGVEWDKEITFLPVSQIEQDRRRVNVLTCETAKRCLLLEEVARPEV